MANEMNTQTGNDESFAFDELESMFGEPVDELAQIEKASLTEDLEGFASCFPSWDLHPPVSRK